MGRTGRMTEIGKLQKRAQELAANATRQLDLATKNRTQISDAMYLNMATAAQVNAILALTLEVRRVAEALERQA